MYVDGDNNGYNIYIYIYIIEYSIKRKDRKDIMVVGQGEGFDFGVTFLGVRGPDFQMTS